MLNIDLSMKSYTHYENLVGDPVEAGDDSVEVGRDLGGRLHQPGAKPSVLSNLGGS